MFSLIAVKYRQIIDIESLDIPGKKTTCVVGESGSGKTTLLRLLNNLISADEGDILFRNKSINTYNPIELRRRVVMLPQLPAVFSGTIKENLLIGLKFSEKQPPSEQKLCDVMKMVHLLKELDQDADKLSGGEKQRLALARVILMDPEVYLLDEPSSSLDEKTEQFVIEKLVEHTRQNGRTLIMVTHSKKIAQDYSDVIIEINQGKVVERTEV